jgi:hypothetical protein
MDNKLFLLFCFMILNLFFNFIAEPPNYKTAMPVNTLKYAGKIAKNI